MMGIVLCAGRGSRLGPLTRDMPKTLLPVGDGRTILDTIFDAVSDHVDHVRVVAGYQSDVLIQSLEHRSNAEVVVVEDVDYWNNARSLWTALHGVDDDVLVANGDTVVHPSVTAAFVNHARTGDIALSVDTHQELGEEQMKVTINGHAGVQSISKQLDPGSSYGEYIGQSIISAQALGQATHALEQAWRTDANSYYEDGYQLAIDAGLVVEPVPILDMGWTEVDDLSDLNAARSLSWL